MINRWSLLAVMVLFFVACSDDGGTTTDGPVKTDQSLVDQGPVADKGPTPDQSLVDQGPTPDGVTADAAPGNTFDIELTVGFGMLVACSTTDTSKDCKGNIYWSVYDTPPPTDPNNVGNPIFQGMEPNGQKGTVLKGKVPVAAKLYVAAFLDDNNNVATPTKPDLGDPVYSDAQFFTATAGQTVKRNLTFDLRMPF